MINEAGSYKNNILAREEEDLREGERQICSLRRQEFLVFREV